MSDIQKEDDTNLHPTQVVTSATNREASVAIGYLKRKVAAYAGPFGSLHNKHLFPRYRPLQLATFVLHFKGKFPSRVVPSGLKLPLIKIDPAVVLHFF